MISYLHHKQPITGYVTGEFTARNIQDDLVRLLNPSSIPSSSTAVDAASTIRTYRAATDIQQSDFGIVAQLSLPIAPSALAALITYLSLLSDTSNQGAFTIKGGAVGLRDWRTGPTFFSPAETHPIRGSAYVSPAAIPQGQPVCHRDIGTSFT